MVKRFKKCKVNGIKGYLDKETGLIWERKQNPEQLSWEEALEYAKSLGDGWRLPTIKELLSIVDYEKVEPATLLPKAVADYYWSSSTGVNFTTLAWYVYFNYGYTNVNYKSGSLYVRCVSSGKPDPKPKN